MNQKQLFITFAILLLSLALTACGIAAESQAAANPKIPEIIIKAADYSFEAPAQIEAGLVAVTLVNNGQEPHHAQVVRLKEGVTLEQFQQALQQGPSAAFPLVVFVGGPGSIDPGLTTQVMLELTPGQYVLLCLIPGHDGVPHLAKGMVAPIQVVAQTGDNNNGPKPKIKADGTVKLFDFSFQLPEKIKKGQRVWQVVNEGQQPHELALIKLAEGKTMADVQAFMQNPHGTPPFANVGGFQAIAPGASGWLNLDLTPGNYVALCHVPDPTSGKDHTELGMVMPFSVK